MSILRCHKLGSLLVAVAVASASLLIVTTAAEAAKVGLFRMKRTWWGGTTTAESADPYISGDWQPRLKGPQKQPSPAVYVGSTIVSGRPAPRFTAPSKFIKDYTWHSACVPGTCSVGYPASSAWYSYWNLPGKWQPNNSRFGGASKTTTVIFPTTMGNTIKPPLNQGNPQTPTTTPCNGGGVTNCGAWAHDFLAHNKGDPISFVGENYDFSRAGSIMITPGKNRFGGTMHFFYGPNHLYYQLITLNTAYLSRAYGPQMDVRKSYTDGSAMAFIDTRRGDHQYGGPFDIYRFTVSGTNPVTTGDGNLYHVRAPYIYTLAPFTTGMVTVDQPGPDFHTEFQLTGYDNRTPNGISGVVSMVRPRLVQTYKVYPNPSEPIQHTWASASAWQMDFHFLPEPGSSAMLASGLVLLAGLYRLRRR
jgi:hypothetical protein